MSTETPTEVKEANIPLEEAGSSSSSTLSAEEVQSKFEKAKKLYNEDKYSEAAELFADVLESQIQKYGELGLECAESYYFYGRTLFLQAKSESNVFGANAQKKIDADSDDEDSDDEEEEAQPAAPTGEEGQSIEKPEDVEGTQIAWETLEVARLIYEKYPEKAPELSDTRYALAEIFLEIDNCEAAIDEFKKCVALREEIFPPNDRRIAEYHLGLAYYSANTPNEAHFHYTKASDVLASNLQTLSPDSTEAEDIKAVLKDLAAKMEEVDPALVQKEASIPLEKPSDIVTEALNGGSGKGKEKEETGFAAPIFDQKTQPITKFGVVGKSVKRATPVTVAPLSSSSTSSSSTSSSSTTSDSAPSVSSSSSPSRSALSSSAEKRKLEDLMGGEEGFDKRART